MPSQSTYAIQDAQFTTSVALGDNASTTRGNGLDLGSATPFPVTQRVTVQIVTTAGNGANNKNVNIPECAITTIPELNALYAVTTVNHALPPSTLRFIRAICVTESSGGNASNGTATLKILF
jgi:hypothetical protein